MTLPKPLKYALIVFALYVAGTLYLRFGSHESWGKALLISLLATPLVLLWWWMRDRLMDRARQFGERHRLGGGAPNRRT
ncbi:hypothetical protein ABZ565_16650 [Streptomyces sp. NPDC016469]|uniref:hypothetical protein n=1 Tax=Streptomyces sp. NPDC016469 TaxID=3157191 RepID=UPI0033D2B9A8